MQIRRVSADQVVRALAAFHTTYPAELKPNDPVGAIVYIATIDGRDRKVYVKVGSDPPLVRSVAWRGEP